jgi:hypothetical protein
MTAPDTKNIKFFREKETIKKKNFFSSYCQSLIPASCNWVKSNTFIGYFNWHYSMTLISAVGHARTTFGVVEINISFISYWLWSGFRSVDFDEAILRAKFS